MANFDNRVVQNAQQFMARVNLVGNEVPAFAEVVNWLASLNSPAVVVDDANTKPSQE